MTSLRLAVQGDAAAIRLMVRSERLNPLGLDWQRFIVAVADNGGLVGCVQVRPHRDGSRELASLVVHPDWRGKGVARSLVQHVLAAEAGPVFLMCRSGLAPFYAKFGFVSLEPGEMPPYFRRVHSLSMRMRGILRRNEGLAIMRQSGEDGRLK